MKVPTFIALLFVALLVVTHLQNSKKETTYSTAAPVDTKLKVTFTPLISKSTDTEEREFIFIESYDGDTSRLDTVVYSFPMDCTQDCIDSLSAEYFEEWLHKL